MTRIAYIDETGDTGDWRLEGSSSCYALGCVVIELDSWPSVFEQVLAFRRGMRESFGIPLRQEIKANYLIRNSGGLRPLNLSPSQRSYVYSQHLSTLEAVGAKAFAIVTDKEKTGWGSAETMNGTWEMLLQRLERMTTKENCTLVICHDSGENDTVRKFVRKARRHLTAGRMDGGGSLRFTAGRILEDPVPRDSKQSYLIQMADLVAYAGWRSYMAPSKGVAQVVPQRMFQRLAGAIKTEVNQFGLNGSVPGVVLRTR